MSTSENHKTAESILLPPFMERNARNVGSLCPAARGPESSSIPLFMVEEYGAAPAAFIAGQIMVTARDPAAGVLAELPDRLLAHLLAKAKSIHLSAHQVLFLAGDPGEGCYGVNEGLLKVSIASPTGAELILAVLGPGSIVGDMAMIDGRPRSASASALRDCKLSFVSRTAFDACVAKYPEINKYLLNLLAERLRKTDELVAAASFLPLKGRLARALLDLASAFGHEVGDGRIVLQQKIGQGDLAAMAGIARENVSRILNEWMRQKIITRSSGYYCLENIAKLEKEVSLNIF